MARCIGLHLGIGCSAAPSGPAIFDLTQAGPMAYWYDARQEAFADGANVTSVKDWSGNGLDLTQPTDATPMKFAKNVVKGLPVFRGVDGVYTGLQRPGVSSEALVEPDADITIFVLANVKAVNDTGFTIWQGAGGQTSFFIYGGDLYFRDPGSAISVNAPSNAWHVYAARHRDGNTEEIFVDGDLVASATSTALPSGTAALQIMRSVNVSDYMVIAAYRAALSDSTLQAVSSSLLSIVQ
jgi:hypothetical protein